MPYVAEFVDDKRCINQYSYVPYRSLLYFEPRDGGNGSYYYYPLAYHKEHNVPLAGRLRLLKRLSWLMMSLTASLPSLNPGSLRPSGNSVKVLYSSSSITKLKHSYI